MPLSLLEIVGSIASGVDAFGVLIAPWRFLLSGAYRQRKREEWSRRPSYIALLQQIGGLIVIALEICAVAILAALILNAYRSA